MRIFSLFILTILLNVNFAGAAGSKIDIPKYDWSWKGFFGTYDRSAAQRGLKVYKEVCSSKILLARNIHLYFSTISLAYI